MKIEPGYYRCRDGRRACVLCVDAPDSRYPIVGYVLLQSDTGPVIIAKTWTIEGRHIRDQEKGIEDLIEPWREPKTTTKEVWVWLWDTGAPMVCFDAPPDKRAGVIGARKVSVSVKEGEWE